MRESIVVEEENRDEGLNGGGTCPTAEMIELETGRSEGVLYVE